MISTAKKYVGYKEGSGNSNRFSSAMGRPAEEWCADFTSAVAAESGNGSLFPNTASCGVAKSWFQSRGRLSVYPAVGAQVFYGDSSSKYGPGGSHTEIVYAYDSTYIYTVGGNTNDNGSSTGDGVYRRKVSRHSAWTDSYGYPAYPEGITCADPSWKGRAGVTYFGQEANESDIRQGGGSVPAPGGGSAVVIDGKSYGPGSTGKHITELGQLLVAAGCGRYKEGPGPVWSSADTESMRAYQLKIGDTGSADGIPGPKQLAKLRADYGKLHTYAIKSGDTLSGLAVKFKTTVTALMKANPQIKDAGLIHIGDVITLP
ncbi:peptidoglycan-binding protein [Streptomyces sp. NPDC057654]|uniref:peptidoglycan-binding protein n=1 Tax=Streptomyces sp. NPDC057654 TaxID=3346196 RepID=UPI00369C79C5